MLEQLAKKVHSHSLPFFVGFVVIDKLEVVVVDPLIFELLTLQTCRPLKSQVLSSRQVIKTKSKSSELWQN